MTDIADDSPCTLRLCVKISMLSRHPRFRVFCVFRGKSSAADLPRCMVIRGEGDLVLCQQKSGGHVGLVKTRRLAYPPLAGADAPWGSRQTERCECRAMQKQQRAKAGMMPLASKQARKHAPFGYAYNS